MSRRTHPVVFRRVDGVGPRGPLAKPWTQVSYPDSASLRAAVAAAARRYFPALSRVDVTLAGPWRDCRGQAFVTTARGRADLEFYPAASAAADQMGDRS